MRRPKGTRHHRAGRLWLSLAVAVGALPGAAGVAQVLPLGPEFQVNTYTTGNQFFPKITVAPDGSFIALWCCGPPAETRPIVGQRFDPVGTPVGAEFAVSQYGSNAPAGVAADADGNFVVVWGDGSAGPGGGNPDYVKGRRFTAEGTPRGDQFVISPPPGGEYLGGASVASHPDGAFVVTWSDGYGSVYGQRYDAGGNPLGANFVIAGGTTYAASVSVGAQPGGGFVVAWDEWNLTPPFDVLLRGQRYDADGLPWGDVFPVSGSEWSSWGETVAVRADGSFVVAWASASNQGLSSPKARLLAADGSPLTAPFVVSSLPTTYPSESPAIGLEADGGFLAVWTSSDSTGSDTSYQSVQARRFAADGLPLGGQFQVNSYTTDSQFRPHLGVQPNGDFVVVWSSDGSSGSDTWSTSVQARFLRPPFFIDGFETGDLSRWSSAQP